MVKEPLLVELPEQIESPRLIIRPPRMGEGGMINAAILESLAELRPWMPWAREAPSVDDTEANLRRAISRIQSREDIRLQFHLKDGTFVGSSGLHRINWSVPKFEIGYWCRTSLTGRGYATEAVEAIASFAMAALGARRIEIRCDEKNQRSRRVPERLKFPLEGILQHHERGLGGELRNTALYAKAP